MKRLSFVLVLFEVSSNTFAQTSIRPNARDDGYLPHQSSSDNATLKSWLSFCRRDRQVSLSMSNSMLTLGGPFASRCKTRSPSNNSYQALRADRATPCFSTLS